MSHACRAIGCSATTRYLMCAPHWRMVPPELKRLWQAQWRDEQTPAWRVAVVENLRELQRIVQAIEAGVPA